jgi:DNA-directed RNA polymerase specialized sigma24 family protein
MAGNFDERQLNARAIARARRKDEINGLAKNAFERFRVSKDLSEFGPLLAVDLSRYTCSLLRNVFHIESSDNRQEVYQQIAYDFLRFASSFDWERPFLPWWNRVVRNTVLDFLRVRARYVADTTVEVRPDTRQMDYAFVGPSLSKLSDFDRLILYEHYIEESTVREIAIRRHESIHTVNYHIRRARAHLRALFEPLIAIPKSRKSREPQQKFDPSTLPESPKAKMPAERTRPNAG